MLYSIYNSRSDGWLRSLYTSSRSSSSLEKLGTLLYWLDTRNFLISDSAADFNGGYLITPSTTDLTVTDSDFSCFGWFNFDTLGGAYQTCFSKYGGANQEWLIRANNTNFHLILKGPALNIDASFAISEPFPGAWFFVGFRYNSITKTFSARINQDNYNYQTTSGLNNTNEPFRVGAFSNGSSPLDGKADSIGCWNRYLSNDEVTSLYNASVGRTYVDLTNNLQNGLISWWDLDEPTGIRIDSIGNINLSGVGSVGNNDGLVAGNATDQDVIKTWKNTRDKTETIIQETFASRPFYSTTGNNGLQEIQFDGIDDNLAGSVTLPSAITVYTVLKQNSWTEGQYIFDGTSIDNCALIQSGVAPELVISAGITGARTNALNTGEYGIITALFTTNSGSLEINNSGAVTGNIGNKTFNNLTLGSRGDGNRFANVNIGIFLIYSGLHNSEEQAAIKTLLANNYNIEI